MNAGRIHNASGICSSNSPPFYTPEKQNFVPLFFQFRHLIFSCKCKALQLQMSCRSKQWKSGARHKKPAVA
ncbi:hypothetical protein CQZ93_09640 [Ochrobactrum vermis]|nr:hypothetical protein CQZ93_09640 [Ochrobactrum vermis]